MITHHNDTLLIASRDIRLTITKNNKVKITDKKNIHLALVDMIALTILEIFSQPCSIANAGILTKTSLKTSERQMKFLATIHTLQEIGILYPAEQEQPILSSIDTTYLSPSIHIRMLNDTKRTQGYIRAIKEVVRPGDVVVDLGTGTGVLAIAAAQAGAKRVYAIEATKIGLSAKELFKANGVEHIIELVQGRSTNVTLPEKADVFISEMIGNNIFDENILMLTNDAQTRFLKPNARLIPGALTVYAVPLQLPQTTLCQYNFSKDTSAKWQDAYGINFSPLLSIGRKNPLHVQILPQLAATWQTSLNPIELGTIDFNKPVISFAQTILLKSNMEFNGLLIAFSAQLSETESISTLPQLATDSNHWTAPVIIYDQPMRGEQGDALVFNYSPRQMELTCNLMKSDAELCNSAYVITH